MNILTRLSQDWSVERHTQGATLTYHYESGSEVTAYLPEAVVVALRDALRCPVCKGTGLYGTKPVMVCPGCKGARS